MGVNRVAELESPSAILDSCCGSGQWCADLAEELPDCLVVGLDLHQPKAAGDGGSAFVRGNVLEGMPFADGTFDYTHQRLVVAAIPMDGWIGLATELVRVTRPGGWVELAESPMWLENTGPATDRLLELIASLAERSGLDRTDIVFRHLDAFLEQAGLQDISTRVFDIPIGDWGAGSLMDSNYRTGWMRLADRFEVEFNVPRPELDQLIEAFCDECQEHHTLLKLAVAVGRKPTA